MSFLHRHRWLTPVPAPAPGLAFLALFFVVPLYYLGYTSLQKGTIQVGYTFTWAWDNYTDALQHVPPQFFRSLEYAGIATLFALLDRLPARVLDRLPRRALEEPAAPHDHRAVLRHVPDPDARVADDPRRRGHRRRRPPDPRAGARTGALLATSTAVIAGITYNFLPFMALPLYVSLEQIDKRLIEAAKDLYASSTKAFLRVTLPLSLPGVFAGTLLTFIPAAGDFINAELLGTPSQQMIGNVIQSKFLEITDYPQAAALSFILMARDLRPDRGLHPPAGHGEDGRMTAAAEPQPLPGGGEPADEGWAFVRRHTLTVFGILAFAYLMLPIAVVVAFSFNDPAGRYNYTWQGFTSRTGRTRSARRASATRCRRASRSPLLATIVATVLGTLVALALVRYQFRGRGATNLLIFLPMATPEIVLGASLLTLFLNLGTAARLLDDRARPHHVLHQLRGRDGAGAARRLRPARGGGGDGPGRERVRDVLPHHAAADRAGDPRRRGCSPSPSRSTTS